VVSTLSARAVPVTGFDATVVHGSSSRTSSAWAQIKESGFDDSVSIQQIPVGGRSTLLASGFSQLLPSTPGLNKPAKTVLESGFGKVTSGTTVTAIATKKAPAVTEVVQILQKPRPAYTEEARKLQIEGEVVLETIFTALGDVRVIRVLRGLGHGLDENAMAAARSIRFVPAQREGKSVDQAGTVRLTFQLAY
jgi:TonB family protein